jgi:diguanylate cyclase (GGDEF)-like protein/PAS domain S-box-containing protein
MMNLDGMLAVAQSELAGCVAAGYVELSTGMLLGARTTEVQTLDQLELVAAATADLFLGPGGGTIEQLFSPSPADVEESKHSFDEFLVFSSDFLHIFIRARAHPGHALVLVFLKQTNIGMTLSRARLLLTSVESAALHASSMGRTTTGAGPLQPASRRGALAGRGATEKDRPVSKGSVVLVEDQAIIARDVLLLLNRSGYGPVEHARTGEEALGLISARQPDLVLMDISLVGEMNGIEAALAIRERWGIPVVFLTAFDADDILARAKLAEPYGYILKPFSERELITAIEMALYKRQAEARLRESARHTQAIIDNMVDGVVTVDAFGIVESFNQSAARIFGYEPAEVIGKGVGLLMPEPYRSQYEDYLHHHRSGGQPLVIGVGREVRGQRKGGECFPMELAVSHTIYEGRALFIGLVRDISQRKRAEVELEKLAFYDPLTGLPNRRLLLDRLRALAEGAHECQHGALLFVDLDHFRQVNETLGHPVGDLLLQQVADRLVRIAPDGATVARLGGDEFVLLLRDLGAAPEAAATQAGALGQALRGALGEAYWLGDHECHSSPSIGVAVFRQSTVNIDTVLRHADLALSQAKAAGRNTVCFFDQKMQTAVLARASLEVELRQALARGQLELHYQPQVGRDGRISGAEALLRWTHPQLGVVSPVDFIPVAESTGLILTIGAWVLKTACEQLARWGASPNTAHLTMAVNVSARQFAQPDFVDQVLCTLQQTDADRRKLKLELTESMLVSDLDDVITRMGALRREGVGFSLDDFGTGFSSLSYLQRLPLDQIKLDKSFVRDVLVDANAAAIARTVVALGRCLGLAVIAEGVELEGQRVFLAELGCHAYQGYLFSRALPVGALDAFVEARG